MDSNPSTFKDPNKPVEMVTWDECQVFLSKLSELTGAVSYTHLIARAAGASARRYTDHQEILSDLYVEKTTKLAKKFQASLLGKLRAAFEEFHAQVTEFAGKLYISMEIAEKRIADRNQKSKGVADLSKAIIEVCEDEKMIKFERTIILDKHRCV